jgi:hypothetical protein
LYWGLKFSPHGDFLYYLIADRASHALGTVEALDGSAETKRFDIEPTFVLRWMPDGQALAFTPREGNIRALPVSGGSSYDLTRVHPGFKVVSFDWSPEGRHLAYRLMASPVDAIAFSLR